MLPQFTPLFIERFWRRVDQTGACWVWTGAHFPFGYGCVHLRSGHHVAHRVSWALAHGPIPDGLWVLHRCDNPPCVRPEHLFLGTPADNNRDRDAKGRHRPGPGPHRRGAEHAQAKLTEAQVYEIRQRRAQGEALLTLAAAYGVSFSHISSIAHHRTWRHLP